MNWSGSLLGVCETTNLAFNSFNNEYLIICPKNTLNDEDVAEKKIDKAFALTGFTVS